MLLKKFRLSEEEKKVFETKETERFVKEMAEWHLLFEKAGAEARAKAQDWSAVDFDASKWKAASAQPSSKYLVRWYRMEFELPKKMQGKNIVFSMGKASEKTDIWLNGKSIAAWNAYDPESSKKAIVKLTPEQFNQTGKNVIAVRGEYYYGGNGRTQMNRIIVYSRLTAGKDVMLLRGKWKMNDEFACSAKETGGKRCPGFISVPYY